MSECVCMCDMYLCVHVCMRCMYGRECMHHAWMRAYVHACGCTHACTRACVSRVQMNDCVCAIHTQDLERLLSCEVWSAQEAIVTLEKVASGY